MHGRVANGAPQRLPCLSQPDYCGPSCRGLLASSSQKIQAEWCGVVWCGVVEEGELLVVAVVVAVVVV
eukprot:3461617-Prorocentrum_lima.AAC.1